MTSIIGSIPVHGLLRECAIGLKLDGLELLHEFNRGVHTAIHDFALGSATNWSHSSTRPERRHSDLSFLMLHRFLRDAVVVDALVQIVGDRTVSVHHLHLLLLGHLRCVS